MKLVTGLLLLTAAAVGFVRADTGVIIPSDRQSPDPAELSIESLKIRVEVDGGHATVHWNEVFRNKTGRVLEGTYLLALPGNAAVSDFAVWDDVTRIPGVILERKRAGELYAQIRNQAIDPGLLQSGEVTESNAPGEAQHSSQFSVKIVPIPAYGYKRIEAEYRQEIALDRLTSEFILPLKPSSAAAAQIVQRLSLEVDVRSPHALASFQVLSKLYPLKITSRSAQEVKGSLDEHALALSDDFVLRYALVNDEQPKVQAYHEADASQPGYFEASALLQNAPVPARAGQRTVVVLFDTSLSMQWEKLERSFQALETTLRSLTPRDLFNVIVFNSEPTAANAQTEPATPDAIAKALDFVRTSRLRGGTNLRKAFESAFDRATAPNTYVVLLSDGELTEGTIAPANFLKWFDRRWSMLEAERRPHIYALAIGDDANARLLRNLTGHAGVFEQIGSTEPLEFKLNEFVRKIGLVPLDSASLTVSPEVSARLVYRLGENNFPGARASWVGEYGKPGAAEFAVTAASGGKTARVSGKADLPATDTQHAYLPAAWARARVDSLLAKIDRDGEDNASIDEVIQLSRKYHFVTPYTSFLAAPRALLRPRLIRPGDPLLRVRTDPSIASVVALFPFGLVKPLRYLKGEDIWQIRFLAPPDLPDGTQTVRLILRDREGHVFREAKTFLISSHPPLVRVHLDAERIHAGGRLAVRVQASATTRSIAVRLYGAEPLFLRWNEAEKSNAGVLQIPGSLPAGRYSVHVTAEDIAHNVSHQEVPLEVLP